MSGGDAVFRGAGFKAVVGSRGHWSGGDTVDSADGGNRKGMGGAGGSGGVGRDVKLIHGILWWLIP